MNEAVAPDTITSHSEVAIIRQYLGLDEIERQNFTVSDVLLRKIEKIEYCRELIYKGVPKYRILEIISEKFNLSKRYAYEIFWQTDVVYSVRDIRLQKVLDETIKAKEAAYTLGDMKGVMNAIKLEKEIIVELYGDYKTYNANKSKGKIKDKKIGFAPETLPAYSTEDVIKAQEFARRFLESKELENYEDATFSEL
jgi:hypothetical protein